MSSAGRRFPLAALPFAAIAVGMTVTACGWLIGLDDRPQRPGEDSDARVEDAVVLDARIDGGATYCSKQDGAVFCEDFDDPGEPFKKWIGFAPAPPVSQLGDASTTISITDAAPSQPAAVAYAAHVSMLGDRAGTLLTTTVDAGGAHAVELSFDLTVDELTDLTTVPREAGAVDGGNPDYDLGREFQIGVGGIGALVAGEPAAALFFFTDRSLAFAVVANQTTSLILGGRESNYGRIAGENLPKIGNALWPRVTILLGETSVVSARAKLLFGVDPSCPNTPAVGLAGTNISLTATKCLAVKDELVNIGSLPVIVTSGVTLLDPGTVRVRVDDIVVRAIGGL